MSTRLFSISIDHVAGVDRPANKRKFLIIKQDKQTDKGATMLTKEQIAKIGDKEIQEAVVAQCEEVAALEKKIKDQDDDIAKLKANPPPPPKDGEDETIWKGVPPAIRNRFEAMQKERDDFAKKAKDEKDERENNVWIAKARQFKYLPVTPEFFGKIMKAVAEHAPTEADEIHRVLGVADEIIAKGAVFSELGKVNRNGNRAADATNVTARVEALAGDYMQLDPKLTKTEAINKVFKEHRDWYEPYTKESAVRV